MAGPAEIANSDAAGAGGQPEGRHLCQLRWSRLVAPEHRLAKPGAAAELRGWFGCQGRVGLGLRPEGAATRTEFWNITVDQQPGGRPNHTELK
jgi:hypothetical protein